MNMKLHKLLIFLLIPSSIVAYSSQRRGALVGEVNAAKDKSAVITIVKRTYGTDPDRNPDDYSWFHSAFKTAALGKGLTEAEWYQVLGQPMPTGVTDSNVKTAIGQVKTAADQVAQALNAKLKPGGTVTWTQETYSTLKEVNSALAELMRQINITPPATIS